MITICIWEGVEIERSGSYFNWDPITWFVYILGSHSFGVYHRDSHKIKRVWTIFEKWACYFFSDQLSMKNPFTSFIIFFAHLSECGVRLSQGVVWVGKRAIHDWMQFLYTFDKYYVCENKFNVFTMMATLGEGEILGKLRNERKSEMCYGKNLELDKEHIEEQSFISHCFYFFESCRK